MLFYEETKLADGRVAVEMRLAVTEAKFAGHTQEHSERLAGAVVKGVLGETLAVMLPTVRPLWVRKLMKRLVWPAIGRYILKLSDPEALRQWLAVVNSPEHELLEARENIFSRWYWARNPLSSMRMPHRRTLASFSEQVDKQLARARRLAKEKDAPICFRASDSRGVLFSKHRRLIRAMQKASTEAFWAAEKVDGSALEMYQVLKRRNRRTRNYSLDDFVDNVLEMDQAPPRRCSNVRVIKCDRCNCQFSWHVVVKNTLHLAQTARLTRELVETFASARGFPLCPICNRRIEMAHIGSKKSVLFKYLDMLEQAERAFLDARKADITRGGVSYVMLPNSLLMWDPEPEESVSEDYQEDETEGEEDEEDDDMDEEESEEDGDEEDEDEDEDGDLSPPRKRRRGE